MCKFTSAFGRDALSGQRFCKSTVLLRMPSAMSFIVQWLKYISIHIIIDCLYISDDLAYSALLTGHTGSNFEKIIF